MKPALKTRAKESMKTKNDGREWVIGTRGSRLALWQAEHIGALLAEQGVSTRLEIIRTKGDLDQETPLPKIGDKGLFTAELDAALLDGRIDLAVHSLKDLPTALPAGLTLAAVPERGAPGDAIVARPGTAHSLLDLKEGACVGSSSLRRSAQILALRPDLRIDSLRGNVETRLRKLDEGAYDAIVLAEAGLERLGLAHRISYRFDLEELVPAVGQGALGIVCAGDGSEVSRGLTEILDHGPTRIAVTAERAFLRRLEGGCQVPVGGHAVFHPDGRLVLSGIVAAEDGSLLYRGKKETASPDAEVAAKIGTRLAEELLQEGAGRILESIRA